YNKTTLKEEGKEGKEPDVAYCFEIDKDKPDLAVEINLTSGSIDDLTKYQYLKIPEVWLWENNKIRFFVTSDSGYLELTIIAFPFSCEVQILIIIIFQCGHLARVGVPHA
ncbi:MAG: hypothetical protein VKJ25_09035, partial [Okeania sp.]|nr:hypothetical protein [Okeania sp.]